LTRSKEPQRLVDLATEIRIKCEQLVSFVVKGDMVKAKETLGKINRLIVEFEKEVD
jgi:predicted translin family RNA/ssDNA-binding protein